MRMEVSKSLISLKKHLVPQCLFFFVMLQAVLIACCFVRSLEYLGQREVYKLRVCAVMTNRFVFLILQTMQTVAWKRGGGSVSNDPLKADILFVNEELVSYWWQRKQQTCTQLLRNRGCRDLWRPSIPTSCPELKVSASHLLR